MRQKKQSFYSHVSFIADFDAVLNRGAFRRPRRESDDE
jgi:hypothetical protein